MIVKIYVIYIYVCVCVCVLVGACSWIVYAFKKISLSIVFFTNQASDNVNLQACTWIFLHSLIFENKLDKHLLLFLSDN